MVYLYNNIYITQIWERPKQI